MDHLAHPNDYRNDLWLINVDFFGIIRLTEEDSRIPLKKRVLFRKYQLFYAS
jgi:hypothetical protein